MPHSKHAEKYNPQDLLKVAQEVFVEGKSIASIIKENKGWTRAKIRAMLDTAQAENMVRIVLPPEKLVGPRSLLSLEVALKKRFPGLMQVHLVPSQKRVLESRPHQGQTLDEVDLALESILTQMATIAASEVEQHFIGAKNPIFAVPFGAATRRVADVFRSQLKSSPNGHVVATNGFHDNIVNRFSAFEIARDLSRELGCNNSCLPLPARIPRDVLQHVEKLELVKTCYSLYDNATIIMFGHGGLRDNFSQVKNYVIPLHDEWNKLEEKGAIGNIGGWWFDTEGNPVTDFPRDEVVVGIGLERIKKKVKENIPVLLLARPLAHRLPSLYTIITKGLANILISDEATAQVLLGYWEVPRDNWPAIFSPEYLQREPPLQTIAKQDEKIMEEIAMGTRLG